MKRFLCFALTLMPLAAFAAPAKTGWSRTYGGPEADGGCSIDSTLDGNYIVVGSTNSFGGSRVWLLKIDTLGDTLWTQLYQGGNIRCVRSVGDGSYIMIGSTDSADVWLVKVDTKGNILWQRTYGREDTDWGMYVCPTEDGGYIITGGTYSNRYIQELDEYRWYADLWLIKTDSFGDTIWTRVLGTEWPDIGACVQETRDGNYIVTGVWDSWDRPWTGFLWWFEVDASGEIIWSHIFHEGDEINDWRGKYISSVSDGGYIISGNVRTNTDPGGVILVKTDSSGTIEWKHVYAETGSGACSECVKETSDSGYIATTDYYWYLLKVNSKGDILWTRGNEGDRVWGRSLLKTNDGGFVVIGGIWDSTYQNEDLWLLKTDSSGDTLSGIDEIPPVSITHLEVTNSIGREVTLRYSDCPSGFHAYVYDASGRRVDELKSPNQNGILIWGPHQNPGVYFIVPDGSKGNPLKVVLIR